MAFLESVSLVTVSCSVHFPFHSAQKATSKYLSIFIKMSQYVIIDQGDNFFYYILRATELYRLTLINFNHLNFTRSLQMKTEVIKEITSSLLGYYLILELH